MGFHFKFQKGGTPNTVCNIAIFILLVDLNLTAPRFSCVHTPNHHLFFCEMFFLFATFYIVKEIA